MPAESARPTRPTMRHVAALAGVGVKTVSRVINGEPNVAPTTAARVREAAARLNYEPDLQASNLRRGDGMTHTIGLLVSDISNPFSGEIYRAIEEAARARGFAVFISSLDSDPARERAAVAAFLRRRVDALVLTTAEGDHSYLVPELNRGTPIISVDQKPSGIDVDAIMVDNEVGAATATRHLAATGHRRIAFLGHRSEAQTAHHRRHGFLSELGRLGIPTSELPMIEGIRDERTAYDSTLAVLDSENPPTAIFSSSQLVTIGALKALHGRGLQNSVAFVGFDDLPLAGLLSPGLTVIAQEPRRVGEIAAERVFARLDGDTGPARNFLVPTRLIVRGSGEIPPTGLNSS